MKTNVILFLALLLFLKSPKLLAFQNHPAITNFLSTALATVNSFKDCQKNKYSSNVASFNIHYLAYLDFILSLNNLQDSIEENLKTTPAPIPKICRDDEQISSLIQAIIVFNDTYGTDNHYLEGLEVLRKKITIAELSASLEARLRESEILHAASIINEGVVQGILADKLFKTSQLTEAQIKLISSMSYQKIGELKLFLSKRMSVLECKSGQFKDNLKGYKYFNDFKDGLVNFENKNKERKAPFIVDEIPVKSQEDKEFILELSKIQGQIDQIQSIMPESRSVLYKDHLTQIEKVQQIIQSDLLSQTDNAKEYKALLAEFRKKMSPQINECTIFIDGLIK
jgi:hypothetical protein